MLAWVFATATCPSVRLSVCPDVCLSHAGIVPSRAKAGSWNVHYLIAPWLCQMRVGWVFSAIFDQYVVISRKQCILDTKLLWDGNRKAYAGYRMVSVSMTLSDPWPGFHYTGRRAFSSAAPQIWNHIPTAIIVSPSLDSFKRHLKAHYFASP